MKNVLYFLALTILSFTVMVGMMFLYVNFSGESPIKKDTLNYLKGVADSKASRIAGLLEKAEADALFLADSKDVADSFDEELVADTVQVTEMVENIAKKTRGEVEEYMKNHPTATVDDMVNDPEFRKIALRRVGETGYTVFHGPDTIINYLHWDPEEQGDDHKGVFERDPEGQQAKLLLAAKDSTEDVSGFYTKKMSDGRLREKFMYIAMLPNRSADGIRLSTQATVFLDDFGKTLKLAKDLDERLRSFKEVNEYQDLILIDPDGNVVWTAEKKNDLGSNLNRGVYRDSELAKIYFKVRESLEVEVSDPGYYEASDKMAVFVTAPIFDPAAEGKKLKGIVAFEIDNDRIEDMMESEIEAEGVGEVYVVNQGRNHITPIQHEIEHELESRHIIQSTQIDRCLEGLRFGERRADVSMEDFDEYDNYADKSVFGVYQYVTRANWCVIAEIDSSDISKRFSLVENRILILYVFIGTLVLSLILALIFKVIPIKKAQ